MKSGDTGIRVPIVVFGYNRPDHLRRTLTALAAAHGANESPLWIFCDGPKAGNTDKVVEAVRGVSNDPCWLQYFRSVTVIVAERNQGLANSIIAGVTRVFEETDALIVLEDDLLVAPDFLDFMNDCLDFYRNDQKVGSVTGFCPLKTLPKGYQHDVIAVPRNCSHGWATWADRWREVDWNARDANRVFVEKDLRRRFNSAGSDRLNRLHRQLAGQIDSWSIRFGLWQTLSAKYTIYPARNRVRNIGFDGSGVHTKKGQNINDQIFDSPRAYQLTWPGESSAVLREFRQVYSGTLLDKLSHAFSIHNHRSI